MPQVVVYVMTTWDYHNSENCFFTRRFITLRQLLHSPLPAHGTQASLSDAPLSLSFAECTLSDCSPLCSCVYLTHFQQCVSTRGPCGHTERGHPGGPSLCFSEALVRQLTIPFCYHSNWPLFVREVPELLVCSPAKGPHVWGPAGERSSANTGFWTDPSRTLTISSFTLLFHQLPLCMQGSRASWTESVVE